MSEPGRIGESGWKMVCPPWSCYSESDLSEMKLGVMLGDGSIWVRDDDGDGQERAGSE